MPFYFKIGKGFTGRQIHHFKLKKNQYSSNTLNKNLSPWKKSWHRLQKKKRSKTKFFKLQSGI